MQRIVIDTNCLQYPDFEAYLAASPTNFGLISQISMVELHKSEAARTTRAALQAAYRYPGQIVILKDMTDLVYMKATSQPLRDLVDTEQTAVFEPYCETVILAPMDEAIREKFDMHADQSRQYVDELRPNAHKIYNLFRTVEDKFDDEDLAQMRTPRRL